MVAVHGQWSSWKAWDECTVTCAGGTQNRTRDCSNPLPQYGGDECEGIHMEMQPCNPQGCPGTIAKLL